LKNTGQRFRGGGLQKGDSKRERRGIDRSSIRRAFRNNSSARKKKNQGKGSGKSGGIQEERRTSIDIEFLSLGGQERKLAERQLKISKKEKR